MKTDKEKIIEYIKSNSITTITEIIHDSKNYNDIIINLKKMLNILSIMDIYKTPSERSEISILLINLFKILENSIPRLCYLLTTDSPTLHVNFSI
jgi:hypothetical protein